MPVLRNAAVLALTLSACVPPAAKRDPFVVPKEKFLGSLQVVAIAPMRAPEDLEGGEEVKARFAATLEQRLAAGGLRVVPPAEVGPLLDAAKASKGGLFDPSTGKFDKEKAAQARKEALAALRAKHGAQALLEPALVVVRAPLAQDVARWDGAEESIGGFWKHFFVGSHSGWIPALSFAVWLYGEDGALLYGNGGGLRVLVKVSARGQQSPIPQAELFADESRNASAVSLAVDPLLEHQKEAPKEPPAPAASPNPGS